MKLGCALLVAALALALGGAAGAEPVALGAEPIALHPGQPDIQRIGKLAWLGGLHLTSRDRRFGGYSGLETIPGGKLAAISDTGHWLVFEPLRDAQGRLIGVRAGEIEPLKNERGQPLSGKGRSDAEALRRDPVQGGFLVAFEREHRLLRYRAVGGPGVPIALPED
ncbi:MAG: esterase-like activity of phytase family protein, partial [Rhodospirillales bacterium]